MPVSNRTARVVKWSAAPVALLASAAVVATASHSAFSATTQSPSSNWQAGSVKLVDDDNNTALFTADGKLAPGSSGTKCITVTSSGDLPSRVALYGTGATTTKALSSHLKLTVEQGTGGGFDDCTRFTPAKAGGSVYDGTLAGFASKATNYSNGLGTWSPTGEESRTYRFTYTLDPKTPNEAQGGTAAIGFTWEAQNTN